MKRIIKLKGELVIAIVIAVTVGMIMSMVGAGIYRKIALTKGHINELAMKNNSEDVKFIRSQLKIDSNNENEVCENLQRNERNLEDCDRIFIVDRTGIVQYSTGKIPINKFDMKIKEGTGLTVQNNKFSAINIMKINDESYVVYINEKYVFNDMNMLYIWVISSVIIFLLLIVGRVSYLTTISNVVNKVAVGDLSARVPIKYNNELSELADNINNMVDKLQNQEEEEKEFITNIAHDLRTPLTTILGYSKMIEEKVYEDEEELKRYISIINNKGFYLKTMLEDFFQYSKLNSNDWPMEKMDINLNELVLQLVNCEESSFIKKGLQLDVNLYNKKLLILGDPTLISRAFSNLISNALKYSKENSKVEVSIKETLVSSVKYGVFTIKNTPKEEISKQELNNFFKRLYKRDKGRSENGSGLGLSITREIVKEHDGFLECKLKGKDLEFIIGIKINDKYI
ncbi:HAMP domain-containing histidine kinase [Clostridium bornimense]|uniref:sensor histidine kinase n=1 Tax=Clostridium bornimense TaxID=1216932 RepID=UPI001C104186|nr:HAMP domain-containing sensor histidine kinase [Clostridium bornimense]MBU5315210.1 HAMP domain-containing histidine kinase [Clostridium bornimense]